ncbi:hypothetical protein Kpol_1023p106 [Vanderwaltozyma polyspora DSM 70294]|uniref:DUF1746 domain-containing protein n=1 Tax=Vanderwaltozyma polyspora (strain ATCC 22028 / DSM 70294 / BCRC 21397 / CBS 2163 / NBRC 10782 / NRRL Y-8283 / UCD 57-17) TaxID=436907 RepID=A7TFX3_VANPO|nr:uncharacterized protein Kpol_1023p106 [Vanderwaltozyma polyspora DSM 70294]EDO18931.1 hypothetical protein Kpol_1023p106 [Vanderwaltozyma polyspora DSM 70294]
MNNFNDNLVTDDNDNNNDIEDTKFEKILSNLEMILYVCLYLKLMIDNSFVLFLITIINLMLIKIIKGSCKIYDSSITRFQLKFLKYFQILLLLQILITIIFYYFNITDKFFLRIIDEETHSVSHNRSLLILLNILSLFWQLVILSLSLNNKFKQFLNYNKYGILCSITTINDHLQREQRLLLESRTLTDHNPNHLYGSVE